MAEQPLSPHGACLLGSFNLTKYIEPTINAGKPWRFDYDSFLKDIPLVVRAMDNIVDRATYPLEEQREEAQSKRRMGLGVTGVANTLEALGLVYGSPEAVKWLDNLLNLFTHECYDASVGLAKEKGPFPLYDERYLESAFIQGLDESIIDMIKKWGIRNSHLTSIAPTGTISLTADNISSGIEPVFSEGYDRTIQTYEGPRVERVDDYGVRVFGNKPKTADQLSPDEHLGMLLASSKWMDSAVSKTCNVGPNVTFDEFKEIYMKAWRGGAKGCTTFRASGKRFGILNAVEEKDEAPVTEFDEGGAACFIDPNTGIKTCDE